MSKRIQDNIVSVILLIIFSSFLYLSFNYSAKARLVPVPIAVASLVLCLVQLYIQNFAQNFDLHVDPSQFFKSTQNETASATNEARKSTVKKQGGSNELVGIGMVLIYLTMMILLGVLPAVFLFVLGFFILVGKIIWYKALLYAVICESVIYFLFVFILKVQMYEGLILKFFLS